MAYERAVTSVGKKAGADLSSNSRYRFVKLDSGTGDAILCDSAGERAYGVLRNAPESGEDASITIGGVAKVEAGESLSPNDVVGTNASGQAVTSATNDMGIVESSAGSGELTPVRLIN